MSYVTKKLDFGSKDHLGSYGISAASNRYSKDIPTYNQNTSVPYTSSSFWNSMNSSSNYQSYNLKNYQNTYESSKPIET